MDDSSLKMKTMPSSPLLSTTYASVASVCVIDEEKINVSLDKNTFNEIQVCVFLYDLYFYTKMKTLYSMWLVLEQWQKRN